MREKKSVVPSWKPDDPPPWFDLSSMKPDTSEVNGSEQECAGKIKVLCDIWATLDKSSHRAADVPFAGGAESKTAQSGKNRLLSGATAADNCLQIEFSCKALKAH